MGVLTAAELISFSDKLTAAYLAVKGTSGSTYGVGDSTLAIGSDWGYSRKMRDLSALLIATGDADVVAACLGGFQVGNSLGGYASFVPAAMKRTMLILNQACGQAGLTGVNSIDTFATYYNIGTGGAGNCLLAPDFATVHTLTIGALSSWNLYSPAVTNMGSQAKGAAFVAGTVIDPAVYVGAGLPKLTIGAYAGPGTDTIVVTGSARTAAGTVLTGRTWTSALITADGEYALTPTVAGDLMLSVSAFTFGATLNAGLGALVHALIPAGRTNPPT